MPQGFLADYFSPVQNLRPSGSPCLPGFCRIRFVPAVVPDMKRQHVENAGFMVLFSNLLLYESTRINPLITSRELHGIHSKDTRGGEPFCNRSLKKSPAFALNAPAKKTGLSPSPDLDESQDIPVIFMPVGHHVHDPPYK